MDEIVNKVAKSGIQQINLEDLKPTGERVLFDIRDHLFEGLILKEQDFRDFVKSHDWSQYEGKNIAITCTTDAIIPLWAYMLLTIKFEPYANQIVMGDLDALEEALWRHQISKINPDEYRGAKVVIKGCGDHQVPEFAYIDLTKKLMPVVSSLMYGEPCSTVPIYKKRKAR